MMDVELSQIGQAGSHTRNPTPAHPIPIREILKAADLYTTLGPGIKIEIDPNNSDPLQIHMFKNI